MNSPFKKLGLALTFSPTGVALLKEAKRLQELFNSELVLIHSGKNDAASEEKLDGAIANAGIDNTSVELIWHKGNPANTIIKSAESANVDLLIAGALEKESVIKYYIGSVARKIMREFSSSVLILKSPSENPSNFKKFCVSTDYSHESEAAIKISYQFALLEKADEYTIIRDFYTPGLSSASVDSGISSNFEAIISTYQQEEEEKMNLFVKELNLKGVNVKIKCLYGREGWEEGKYVRENNADIFVVNGRVKRFNFFERFFPDELEFSFKHLPSNLLIIR
ncbi:MAG: universal stress protein [Ignavibacteriaceae bacterium]